MSDTDENDFLETLTTYATDEDWADFWASEEPLTIYMNDKKLEEINA